MQIEDILLNATKKACNVDACAIIIDSDKGNQSHNTIASEGFFKTMLCLVVHFWQCTPKCGACSQTQSVLEDLFFFNVVSWSTSLVANYVQWIKQSKH